MSDTPERCPTCGRTRGESALPAVAGPERKALRCSDSFHILATPDTPQERGDCGVCGVPADALVEVTHDGYMVPRCADHVEERPYQAEARLEQAASTLAHVERERDEQRERVDRHLADGLKHQARVEWLEKALRVIAGDHADADEDWSAQAHRLQRVARAALDASEGMSDG